MVHILNLQKNIIKLDTNPSEAKVSEAKPLLQAKSAQTELFILTKAGILAKLKTANIDTNSRYAFGLAHEFGMLWKQT